MIVALILATAELLVNLRFLCALHRELQLAKLSSRIRKAYAVTGTVIPPGGHGEANQAISDHHDLRRIRPQQENKCSDVIFIGITVVFFVLSIAYVYACGRWAEESAVISRQLRFWRYASC